jgi:oligopeptidase A
MTNIKQKIRQELQNPDFPDFIFLYSREVLDLSWELLQELLAEEKKDFEEKISRKYIWLDQHGIELLTFQTFDDFSELDYFFSLLEHYQWVHNDEVIRQIIEDFEPLYIDFGNEVAYNKRLYEMYLFCEKNTELNSQERRIIEKTLKAYEVRGIALPEDQQARLKKISKELSELSQKFSNNVLDDRKTFEYIITDASLISEMPEDDKNIAQKKAEEKWKKWFLFDASAASHTAIMRYCSDESIRKHFYEARIQFASAWKYDNREIILKILKLREEKSHILGYKNYAELSLVFKMAETPEQIQTLFENISKKARPKAEAELQEIKSYFWLTHLEAWDSSYYSRKLREEKYTLDEKELKKYFVFENVRDALFETVKRLYSIEMKKISLPYPHLTSPNGRGIEGKSSKEKMQSFSPIGRKDSDMRAVLWEGSDSWIYDDIQIYEVYKDGNFVSYFYTDYFYTPLKRQGAWADIQREVYQDKKKIVVNVCNFQKNTDWHTLLTLDEVETMYHEFGHAIHEMLSVSHYSELSGFHVEWDFVELPSQLLENWCRHPEGMKLFAKHWDTGEVISEAMLEKLQKLETFGNGNMVLKQNEFAMLDMRLHSETVPKNIESLQKVSDELYMQNSLFALPKNYKSYASFSHIFDGGYAAGYYSYMWAEIIEKEVWKVFVDSGDIFSPEVAHKFYTSILWAGTTKKASELFQDFLWRDPQIDAFLQEKGLVY